MAKPQTTTRPTQDFTLDPKEYAKQYALTHGAPRRAYLRECKAKLEAYVAKEFSYQGAPVRLAEVFTVRAEEPTQN